MLTVIYTGRNMPRTHLDKLKETKREQPKEVAPSLREEPRDYVKISADFLADIVEGKLSCQEEDIGTRIKTAELLLKAGELLKDRGICQSMVFFEGENEILP